jgi:hypothetical protein
MLLCGWPSGKGKAAFFRIMKGICFVEIPFAALGRDTDNTFFLRLKTTLTPQRGVPALDLFSLCCRVPKTPVRN